MEIISNHISCVALPGELPTAIEAGYNEIFVMTSTGIIKHHKLRGQNRFVRIKVEKIPNYKETPVHQEVNFLPDGKIPIELFDQIVGFFKQVMDVKKQELEAMIWVCWDQENGYHLIVPDQRVGKASASYDWASLPTGKTIVCDIHSHNTMGAFFSGTDNRDDQGNIGFSGVVGHLKAETPQTKWRFNYKDVKIDCDFDDIFMLPARDEQVVPEEWIGKIVTVGTSSYGSTYGGNSQKGKADHLVPWQYQRGHGGSEGVREGPQLRAEARRSLPEEAGKLWQGYEGSLAGDAEFHGELWDYDRSLIRPDDDFGSLLGGYPDERSSSAEQALARITEDPDIIVDTGVHLFPYDSAYDPDVIKPFAGDDRYEEVESEHGKDVADVFCLIDDGMAVLNGKDELVETLMGDMIHMVSEDGQKRIFKRIFEELPQAIQESIQMNGL
jgi:PRTRC genetic system protein A